MKKRKPQEPWWHRYQVGKHLEVGKQGAVELVKFKITEAEARHFNMRQMFNFVFDRGVAEGDFIKLLDHDANELWMSDTPAEISDLTPLFSAVKQHTNGEGPTVLMHGLGLGVALKGCFVNGARHVTVVEINPDVIELVGKQWKAVYGDKLEIIEGDALTMKWPVGSWWNIVWNDIWPQISLENVNEMSRLHRRFGSRSDWQSSWCRPRVKSMQREDRERPLRFW